MTWKKLADEESINVGMSRKKRFVAKSGLLALIRLQLG